jgi:hypothetical protein
MCREKMRDGCRRDTGRGDMIAEGENSRVLPNTRSQLKLYQAFILTFVLLLLILLILIHRWRRMRANSHTRSQEPVLPLRLVLCCTLSSLSCFNLADATP